ncbi:OLC1v1016929C1 [Oldenlandia corymbosa var. corymbosa]|uniref:OLC1v1016929C1 n=1 Tax=Oldenlandia corymbosa var. corymbosa TaxID=529605 RepID=A0AAV1E8F5_OLDCO|nr:OLC1v1016929C1 [Oldenlandia corymbosa var. corymbosa]
MKLHQERKMEAAVEYIAGFAIFILFILCLFIKNQVGRRNQPPSPPSLPIIGHLHLLKEPFNQTMQSLCAEYGDVLLLRLGVRKVLIVSSPSAAEECFTKNDIIFANRPKTMSAKHFSYNYTTMSVAPYGDYWRNLRRLAALEIFSPARMASFAATRKTELVLVLNELMRKCRINGGSAMVDFHSISAELTFNMLSMTLAGKRYYGENAADDEEARKTKLLIKEMLVNTVRSNKGDYLPFLRWIDYKGVEKKFSTLMNRVDKFIQDLVDDRRQLLFGSRIAEGFHGQADKPTMIDHLLQLQKDEPAYYTDQLIKGIVMILLIAATDTVSITMEWAMALLLNNPEAIKKIKGEIDDHVPQDRLLEERDLPRMTYLQNVVKETLRFYPPIPFMIPHEASEDCTVSGYNISKDTMLLVNLWAIHRDPKLWENPMKFMPERHEGRRHDDYSLMPFGAGRRGCPGAGLGTRILEFVLGTFVQAFEWERTSEELVDMTEGKGFSLPKLNPLEAICRPRQATIQHALIKSS